MKKINCLHLESCIFFMCLYVPQQPAPHWTNSSPTKIPWHPGPEFVSCAQRSREAILLKHPVLIAVILLLVSCWSIQIRCWNCCPVEASSIRCRSPKSFFWYLCICRRKLRTLCDLMDLCPYSAIETACIPRKKLQSFFWYLCICWRRYELRWRKVQPFCTPVIFWIGQKISNLLLGCYGSLVAVCCHVKLVVLLISTSFWSVGPHWYYSLLYIPVRSYAFLCVRESFIVLLVFLCRLDLGGPHRTLSILLLDPFGRYPLGPASRAVQEKLLNLWSIYDIYVPVFTFNWMCLCIMMVGPCLDVWVWLGALRLLLGLGVLEPPKGGSLGLLVCWVPGFLDTRRGGPIHCVFILFTIQYVSLIFHGFLGSVFTNSLQLVCCSCLNWEFSFIFCSSRLSLVQAFWGEFYDLDPLNRQSTTRVIEKEEIRRGSSIVLRKGILHVEKIIPEYKKDRWQTVT